MATLKSLLTGPRTLLVPVAAVALLTTAMAMPQRPVGPVGGPSGRSWSHPAPAHRPTGAVSAPVLQRLLWVWHPMDPDQLLAMASQDQVTRLLVWVSPGFTSDPAALTWLRDLRTRAQGAGVHLDALCGDPSWALRPAAARDWAREVAGTHLFERLHLDIEPHALPQWSTDPAPLVSGLLAALTQAGTAGIPVDADTPYWYWQVPAGSQTLDVAVLRRVSGITIMAYQRTADLVAAAADTEARHAAAVGKPVFVAVNIRPPDSDGLAATLWGQPLAQVLETLGVVRAKRAQWPTLAGDGIHDAETLATLS